MNVKIISGNNVPISNRTYSKKIILCKKLLVVVVEKVICPHNESKTIKNCPLTLIID